MQRLRALTTRGPRSATGDRGSVSVETILVFPTMLLLLFVIVQGGVWFHARNVALTAAREGVSAARVASASGDGATRARTFATNAGGGALTNVRASASGSTADTVRITVTGRAAKVLPGIPALRVTQTAAGPRERFVPR